jgi:hypothetical protein
MNRQNLRTIAICVVFANSLPLLAAEPATVVQTGQASFGASQAAGIVEGRVVDDSGKPIANASVRLRDLTTGKVAGSLTSNNSGHVTFRSVNPGTYVAELVGGAGKVLAASQMFPVAAGQAVSAFISIPAAFASLGGAIASHAAVAAIVIASAAAAGILAVQSSDCVSPPCQ